MYSDWLTRFWYGLEPDMVLRSDGRVERNKTFGPSWSSDYHNRMHIHFIQLNSLYYLQVLLILA